MTTVAFDVIGTLFTLERLRAPLAAVGESHELWFAESLRDYFALSHSGSYAPLREVLGAGLGRRIGDDATSPRVEAIMSELSRLDPAPGAARACAALSEAGCKLVALTNGSAEVTTTLLERAGLFRLFSAVRSCDEIEVSKPHPRVYEMAKSEADADLWMVAAHAWDCAGAARAGIRAAWVSGKEGRWLEVHPAPDVTAADLEDAAGQIARRRADSSWRQNPRR